MYGVCLTARIPQCRYEAVRALRARFELHPVLDSMPYSSRYRIELNYFGLCRNTEVARRLAGYPVATEVARRPERPEVNGDVRKTA